MELHRSWSVAAVGSGILPQPVQLTYRQYVRLPFSLQLSCSLTDILFSTSAAISTGLLPRNVASTKIDFAVTLDLPESLIDRLIVEDVDTVTQSTYAPLRFSPILLDIETKMPGMDWKRAKTQISTWMLAGKQVVLSLMQRKIMDRLTIPPRPLIIVQGQDWNVLLVEDGQEKDASIMIRVSKD